MSRVAIAYLIIVAIFAGGAGIVVLSHRFARYRRAIMRGSRSHKPVWKPFWIR